MDKVFLAVFLCLCIIFPISNECGTSESPTMYQLNRGYAIHINSPNYPYNYPNNQACHWLLQSKPGYVIRYTFKRQFQLDTGVNCQYDSVTLYDSSTTANVIGSYCGSNRPRDGDTTGRYLYIIFKSDGSSAFAGFLIEVEVHDHDCGTATSPITYLLDPSHTVQIKSPWYPQNYPITEKCYWLVQAPPEKKIKYRFIGLYALQPGYQCQYDNVTLYDSSTTTNVIGSYCGSSPPNPGTTTGRYLYVSLNTDDDTPFNGFNLEVSVKEDECGATHSPITYVLNPGRTISITSPNYTYSYPENGALDWLVLTAPGSRITYRFMDQFQLETHEHCNDNVTLYDSSNATNVIGTYCGSFRPNHGTTTGRYLYVSFKSDGRSAYAGFSLEISSKQDVCRFPKSPHAYPYMLSPGHILVITSPNYPNKYPDNQSLHWLVQTTPDSKLKYRFIGGLHLDSPHDTVTMYDSSRPTNGIEACCGWPPRYHGTTTGRYLYVSFKSGRSTPTPLNYYRPTPVHTGFILEIISTNHVCGSLTTYVLETGQKLNISSPNYPLHHPKDETCDWLVQTAPANILEYRFIGKFDIMVNKICYTYVTGVTLYDSSTPTNVIGTYCGRTTPNPGTTTGRYLYVRFKSDDYISYTGFNLEITSTTGGI